MSPTKDQKENVNNNTYRVLTRRTPSGGNCNSGNGLLNGLFALNVNNVASNSNWNYGVSLTYTNPSLKIFGCQYPYPLVKIAHTGSVLVSKFIISACWKLTRVCIREMGIPVI